MKSQPCMQIPLPWKSLKSQNMNSFQYIKFNGTMNPRRTNQRIDQRINNITHTVLNQLSCIKKIEYDVSEERIMRLELVTKIIERWSILIYGKYSNLIMRTTRKYEIIGQGQLGVTP